MSDGTEYSGERRRPSQPRAHVGVRRGGRDAWPEAAADAAADRRRGDPGGGHGWSRGALDAPGRLRARRRDDVALPLRAGQGRAAGPDARPGQRRSGETQRSATTGARPWRPWRAGYGPCTPSTRGCRWWTSHGRSWSQRDGVFELALAALSGAGLSDQEQVAVIDPDRLLRPGCGPDASTRRPGRAADRRHRPRTSGRPRRRCWTAAMEHRRLPADAAPGRGCLRPCRPRSSSSSV